MIKVDPVYRITSSELVHHPWFLDKKLDEIEEQKNVFELMSDMLREQENNESQIRRINSSSAVLRTISASSVDEHEVAAGVSTTNSNNNGGDQQHHHHQHRNRLSVTGHNESSSSRMNSADSRHNQHPNHRVSRH